MRFVAKALGYGAGQSVGGAGLSVGEMTVDSLVEPLRDTAHTECHRRKRMQSCFGAGKSEWFGPDAWDFQQIGAVEGRGQILRIQPWVENNFHAGILLLNLALRFFPSWSILPVANEIELDRPPE